MSLAPAILAASPTLRKLAGGGAGSRAVNLDKASNQWATRPAEQRHWTVADAAASAQARHDRLTLLDVRPTAYTIEARQDRPALIHKAYGNHVHLAPLAFEQLSRAAGAPASYLASLPATLASDCLRHGWESRAVQSDTLRLQIMDVGNPVAHVRAITSPTHDLTPNASILRSLANLTMDGSGWKLPPARAPQGWAGPTMAATQAQVLTHAGYNGMSPQVGDIIAPSGVYESDRDMFCILVDDSPAGRMEEDGGLYRFVMVSNSETATGALEITTGWMRGICGNHIVWGARDIIDIRAIHRGSNASRSVSRIAHQIERRAWADDRQETAAMFAAARACQIADSKEDLVSLLFTKKRILPKAMIENAWNVNQELAHIDGPTGSAWGVMNALTRISQCQPFQADRHALDAAAAKVAQLVSVN